MPKVYLRQSVGIDISKDKLQCRHGLLKEDLGVDLKASKSLANKPSGFSLLQSWLEKHTQKYSLPLRIILEATGVYHESLVYFLKEHGYEVCVVLPKAAKHYAKSLSTKTKNDQIDAGLLARMGLERKLRPWEIPSEKLKTLKELTREVAQLKKERSRLKNQLHAKSHAYQSLRSSRSRIESRIELINQQLQNVEKEIDQLVEEDPALKEPLDRISKVEGLGRMTILTIIAETDGFALFTSLKQLTSFAGLDVIENQSGNFKGKTRISKAGNARIRAAIYMPALCAARHNPALAQFYQRVLKSQKVKKQAVIAVARKLLGLIYTLWKSGQEYRPLKAKISFA